MWRQGAAQQPALTCIPDPSHDARPWTTSFGICAMVMTPQVRKLALTTHVTASVGWVGALMVFFVHAIVSLTSQDTTVVRQLVWR